MSHGMSKDLHFSGAQPLSPTSSCNFLELMRLEDSSLENISGSLVVHTIPQTPSGAWEYQQWGPPSTSEWQLDSSVPFLSALVPDS